MPRLDIYVGSECFGCAEARRLAGAIAGCFETVSVQVIDLEVHPELKPDAVIAVPAYVLDGRVLAFGNPCEQDLCESLRAALASDRTRG